MSKSGSDPRYLMQQAESLEKGASSGFSFFGGKSDKLEKAADHYTRAANAFRLQNNGKEAGKAFERAANLHKNSLDEPNDAANSLQEAFKAYRKTDPEDAARCLEQAIEVYTLAGNFRRAATQKQTLGELYEVELGDNKRALAAYETAANWFEQDNAEALANKMHLKVADIAALDGDYYKAIENFERVGKSAINNNLMRYSVKDYLFKAGMCHLATGDLVGANNAMEGYRDLDNQFPATREHQLLMDLMEAVQQGDQDMFADKLFQFDQMSKLDKWKTTIFLRIKDSIQEQGDDFS